MDTRKETIIACLRKFIAQRPGLEFANYGDVALYRAEMRSITYTPPAPERTAADGEQPGREQGHGGGFWGRDGAEVARFSHGVLWRVMYRRVDRVSIPVSGSVR